MNLKKIYLSVSLAVFATVGCFSQTSDTTSLKDNDNKTAIEVYNVMKSQGRGSRSSSNNPPQVNISGYAVKVGPDVYGLPSVELSEKKGGKARTLCVLPFTDYLKLRHVSKGDKVVMKGEVRGYSSEYDIVVVKQSKIVTINDKKP